MGSHIGSARALHRKASGLWPVEAEGEGQAADMDGPSVQQVRVRQGVYRKHVSSGQLFTVEAGVEGQQFWE